ncbi:MAG: hypothetical protein LBU73_09750 [Helicobacteraceae bacterium]|nr:hypothetical protein [Helicobacteraceae bacterium]
MRTLINAGHTVDIFIHTWSENDHIQKKPLSPQDIEYIKKKYKPVKLLIEQQKNMKPGKNVLQVCTRTNYPYDQIYKQYYTMYAAARLRAEYEEENGILYDYAISMDVEFRQPLDIVKIYEFYTGIRNRCLSMIFTCISLSADYDNLGGIMFLQSESEHLGRAEAEGGIYGGCKDVFVFGSGLSMTKAMGIWECLDECLDKYGFYNHEVFINLYWRTKCELSVITLNYIHGREWVFVRVAARKSWMKKILEKL